jgi:hypothetical protein
MNSNDAPPPTQHRRVLEKHQVFIIKSQKSMIQTFAWNCCLNCDHWNREKQWCNKWNVLPPLEVIVVGCEDYENAIPF